jgi:hypothetical protein
MNAEERKAKLEELRLKYKECGLRLGALRAGLEQFKMRIAEERRKDAC